MTDTTHYPCLVINMANSPPKSPRSKKSPIIYHGPTPTLAGIPTEIGRHIGSFLPREAIGTLQRTAKFTQKMTKTQLQSFCASLPTEDELMEYIEHLLEVRKTETISFYDAQSADTRVTMIVFNGATLGLGLTHIVYTFNVKQIGEWLQIVGGERTMAIAVRTSFSNRDDVLQWTTGIPDPYTVARIVRKRKSCVNMHNATNSDMNYGVELATGYARAVLAPFFAKIVTNVAQLYDFFSNPKSPQEQLKTIPDDDEVIVHQFEADLERVKILVWSWLQLRDPQQLVDYATDWEGPEDIETIRIAATTVVAEYITRGDINEHRLTEEDSDKKELPTREEIVNWLKNELRKNRPINVRLFDPTRTVVTITSDNSTLLVTSSRIVTYNRKENTYYIKTTPPEEFIIEKHINALAAAQILTTKLYGLLDSTTLLAIMKSRPEAEGVLGYGEAEVQSYTRTMIDSLASSFILFDNMEALYARGKNAPFYVEQSLIEDDEKELAIVSGRLLRIWQLLLGVNTWLVGEPIPELFGNTGEIVSAMKRYFRFYDRLATTLVLTTQQQQEEGEELGGETAEEEEDIDEDIDEDNEE